jgi:small subunit ribosomal protein S2
VGTKKQAQQAVEREAKRCGMFFVNNRWLGGMLTNFATIRKSLQRLKKIEKMEVDGTFENLTKKEIARLNKERARLEKTLGGIKEMKDLPGVVFIIDTRKESIAVAEARRMGIPIVGIVDTNCNPEMVDFPIPGNDDAIRAINLFTQIIANAVIDAENEVGLEVIETLQDEGEVQPEAGRDFASAVEGAEVIDKDRFNPDGGVETVPLAETVGVAAKSEEEAGFTDKDYSDYNPEVAEEKVDEPGPVVGGQQLDEDKLYEE